jgi:hypothetical protein
MLRKKPRSTAGFHPGLPQVQSSLMTGFSSCRFAPLRPTASARVGRSRSPAFRRCSSMVEHLFCKQAVAGSNPAAGSSLGARRDIFTARWCNGSTNDSDSFCHGSSPCRAAIRRGSREARALLMAGHRRRANGREGRVECPEKQVQANPSNRAQAAKLAVAVSHCTTFQNAST